MGPLARTRRPSRPRHEPRALVEQVGEFIERWAPPGGWILAALVLITLSTVAGVIFPMSPAGIALQTLVGALGAPLVPAWSAWTTWQLARRERPNAWRVSALVVLSPTWL